MKINFYNTFVVFFIAFSGFVVFGDKYLSIADEQVSYDELISKDEAIVLLSEEYDAKLASFKSDNNFSEFINNNVVLDSLLVNTFRDKDKFFAEVLVSNNGGLVKANLECDEETFEKLNSMRNTTVIIAAKINKLQHNKIPYFIESLENEKQFYDLNDEYKIEGKCLKVIEVSVFDT